MESIIWTEALSALAHPERLAVFRLLARRLPGAARPGEIAAALSLKRNTLSVYLAALQRAGLVEATRDGRAIHYHLNIERTRGLIDHLVSDCCRGRPELCEPLNIASEPLGREIVAMSERVFNVAFICTGNSARSILAEAILNREGAGKFRAFSAGTRPKPAPHPLALQLLEKLGYDTSGLRSKDLRELQSSDSPKMDFVFTVCDNAANEECPTWPGQPMSAHWGIPDPAAVEGSESERALAFSNAYRTLRHRLTGFMALPVESLDRMSLQREIDRLAGADAPQSETGAAG